MCLFLCRNKNNRLQTRAVFSLDVLPLGGVNSDTTIVVVHLLYERHVHAIANIVNYFLSASDFY